METPEYNTSGEEQPSGTPRRSRRQQQKDRLDAEARANAETARLEKEAQDKAAEAEAMAERQARAKRILDEGVAQGLPLDPDFPRSRAVAPEDVENWMQGNDPEGFEKWMKKNSDRVESWLSDKSDLVVDRKTGKPMGMEGYEKNPRLYRTENDYQRGKLEIENDKTLTPGEYRKKITEYEITNLWRRANAGASGAAVHLAKPTTLGSAMGDFVHGMQNTKRGSGFWAGVLPTTAYGLGMASHPTWMGLASLAPGPSLTENVEGSGLLLGKTAKFGAPGLISELFTSPPTNEEKLIKNAGVDEKDYKEWNAFIGQGAAQNAISGWSKDDILRRVTDDKIDPKFNMAGMPRFKFSDSQQGPKLRMAAQAMLGMSPDVAYARMYETRQKYLKDAEEKQIDPTGQNPTKPTEASSKKPQDNILPYPFFVQKQVKMKNGQIATVAYQPFVTKDKNQTARFLLAPVNVAGIQGMTDQEKIEQKALRIESVQLGDGYEIVED